MTMSRWTPLVLPLALAVRLMKAGGLALWEWAFMDSPRNA